MSQWSAIRCERCDSVALYEVNAIPGLRETPPRGYSTVLLERAKPFLNTGHIDLCGTCTDELRAWLNTRAARGSKGE